jgi:heat shock protein HspQ
MNPDFFVKLTLGAYRVTDLLPSQGQEKGEIRSLANSVLAHLILFSETNPVTQEQRQSLIPKIQGEIGSLVSHFAVLKNNGKAVQALNGPSGPERVEPKYFLILEKEYQGVSKWVEEQQLEPSKSDLGMVPKPDLEKAENSLSERQKRILGILQNKEKTQVWELQKVLTEVTKRTLRRDLDELLSLNLIERKGEWNAVFYRLKQ